MSTAIRLRPARLHRAAGALAAAAAALVVLAPGIALAIEPPIDAPPDADGRCDTMPTSYPGNGIPVPADASCSVVTTPTGIPVAEVWAWGDDTGMHWYNYVAEGYVPGDGYALTMCATDDPDAEDVVYVCTTDSYYLLFTMANVFVTWPSDVGEDEYYCESVDVIGPGGVADTAHACGTLSYHAGGELAPPPTTAPPTTPADPPPPPATTPPPPPPATSPDEPIADDSADPAESSPPASTPGAVVPTAGPPATTTPAGPDGLDPRLPEDALGPGPVATPVDSQSVALVEGSSFPVALVYGVAAALALGGIAVLAGPGVIATIRRRT